MKKRQLLKTTACAVVFVPFCAIAQQQAPQLPPLPMDAEVRYGKLDNGLTYYIRHNELPKDRAEFYIAQKVGSIQEEEDQRGLAHFLEHMAFNGTKNFPGKSMLDYLEKNGVKFGTNVNAYTSIDETVYNLSGVPTINPGLIDSCLLILHDWSGFISLEDEEIDNERGVIHEEWRTRSNPFLRMYEETVLPAMFPDNRYGHRMPIGLMEVVNNFPYQTLKDYYDKWYRPDLQGIVIVGDINVDSIEARIKEMWADIPAHENPAERIYYPVQNNEETIVAIGSDKEATKNFITVNYKMETLPDFVKQSQLGFVMSLADDMIVSMLNNRFHEVIQKPDAPFLVAGVDKGQYIFAKTKDAFDVQINFKEGDWEKGLVKALELVNSAKTYGFTDSEYDRVKADILSSYENAYNERDKVKNGQYVQEYLNHFLNAEPTPGIELEYEIVKQILEQLPLEQVNQLMSQYVTDNNIAIMYMGVEKEGIKTPNQEEILAVFNAANQTEPVAYVDNVITEPLIAKLPKAGKVKKQENGKFETTIWTLSNGAKVIFKPTDFKKDQITMQAVSFGGSSLLPESDLINTKVLGSVLNIGGVGNFSATDLKKVLSGKKASASVAIGDVTESVNASSTPKDLETMLQLVYLNFTAPRMDQEAFDAWKQRTATTLENYSLNPDAVISDSITATLYSHNPKAIRLQKEELDLIDYSRINDIRKERFANAGDFTFVFSGNINPEEAKPLIEQYIASLPSNKKKEAYKVNSPDVAKGKVENRFTVPMTTPKVTVFNVYSGDMEYNLKNVTLMNILQQVMSNIYIETIREEEGGTYGVGVRGSLDKVKNDYVIYYSFDTGEEKRARLEERAYAEFNKVAEEGFKPEILNKVKEYLNKSYQDNLKENGYWAGVIMNNYLWGNDTYTEYKDILDSITLDDVQQFAKKYFHQATEFRL